MQTSLIPPPLAPGATIGIVAPARWPSVDLLRDGTAWLESQGFKVKVHPQVHERDGRLAGSDKQRADAINAMFADPSINAILCARGGTGSFRLVDLLDYDLIRKHPKIFCGFSDLTTLLHVINRRTGLITFHSPMLWNFSRAANDPRTKKDWLELLSGKFPAAGKDFPAQCLVLGQAQGRLIGGNLSMLRNLIGTPDDWHGQDSILFIEDIDEPLYKIDHMLWQLQRAVKFIGLRGLIVGTFTPHADDSDPSNDPNNPPYGKTLPDLLRQYLPSGIPICLNFPCGHGDYLTSLPVGGVAHIVVQDIYTHLTLSKHPQIG